MWRYRCDSCGTTSLPVNTRVEAIAERDAHRYRKHGGHIPDGEHLQRSPHPGPGSIRPAVIAVILIALLLLLITH